MSRDSYKSDVPFQVAVVLVALGVRIIANAWFQGLSAPPNPDFPDPLAYTRLAQSLATAGRYEIGGQLSVHFPPGVPFILLPVFLAVPSGFLAARLLFSLLGAATCVPVYGVARVLGGRLTGRVAAVLLAFYPEHFYWSMHFSPEVPVGLLMMCTAWLALRMDRAPSWQAAVALGALFGAQALVTPRMLLFFVVFWILRLANTFRNGVVRAMTPAVLATAGFLMIVAPWTARNHDVSGKFILVSSHGGSTLLAGNNPLVLADRNLIGGWYQGALTDIPGWKAIRDMPDEERSREATKLAITFIRSLSVGELLRLETMKLYRFLTPLIESPNRTYRLATGLSWLMIAPFVLLGLVAFWRSSEAYGLHAVLLTYVLTTLVFFGEARYRASIAPVLVTYAALGITMLARRIVPGRMSRMEARG